VSEGLQRSGKFLERGIGGFVLNSQNVKELRPCHTVILTVLQVEIVKFSKDEKDVPKSRVQVF